MIDLWSKVLHEDFDIPGLAEGLIFPQRGYLNSRFFKNKNRTEDCCSFSESGQNGGLDFVRVLVGPKGAVQQWLKVGGPGSCTLWVELAEEHMDLSHPDAEHRLLRGHLQLAYMLKSSQPFFEPVLNKMAIIVTPHVQQGEAFSGKKPNHDNQASASPLCGKWHTLRQREKEKFLKSIGVNHLGDGFCIKVINAHGNMLESCNWIRRWFLALPWAYFKQLVSMVLPCGTLWQFQQLVGKLVHLSEFIDVKYQLIDFKNWLENHTYIALLEGLEFLVTLGNLQWTAVRFNFAENLVNITGDKGLDSLNTFWLKRVTDCPDDDKNGMTQLFDKKTSKTEVCTSMVKWKVYQASRSSEAVTSDFPVVEDTFLDLMYREGGFTEEQASEAFKNDFSFLACKQDSSNFSATARVQGLQSGCLSECILLSSKERCGLSNLGSNSRSVRQRGLWILLDILLDESREKGHSSINISKGNVMKSRFSSAPVSAGSQCCTSKGIDTRRYSSAPTSGNMSRKESLKGTPRFEKSDHFRGRDAIGKQSQGSSCMAIQHGHEEWVSGSSEFHRRPENELQPGLAEAQSGTKPESGGQKSLMSSDRSRRDSESVCIRKYFEMFYNDAVVEDTPNSEIYSGKVESIKTRLLEWVQNGFLESLIEEAIETPRNSKTGLNIEETANICIKVINALPADGSSHVVQSLMFWLKFCTGENCLLNSRSLQPDEAKVQNNITSARGDGAGQTVLDMRVDMDQSLEKELERVWCLSKLVLTLISASNFIASGIAEQGGLTVILELYGALVRGGILDRHGKNWSSRFKRAKITESLPGGISDHQKRPLTVSSISTNFSHFFRQKYIINLLTPRPIPDICRESPGHDTRSVQRGEGGQVTAEGVCRALALIEKSILWCRGEQMTGTPKTTSELSKPIDNHNQSKTNRSTLDHGVEKHMTAHLCLEKISRLHICSFWRNYLQCTTGSGQEKLQAGQDSHLSVVQDFAQSSEVSQCIVRPKVPKLILKPCLLEQICENSLQETGPLQVNISASAFANSSSSSSLKTSETSSKASLECCVMALEAKIHLLEAFTIVLGQNSTAASIAKQNTAHSLLKSISSIVSSFIVDLYNSYIVYPLCDVRKLQSSIFEVMLQMDSIVACCISSCMHGESRMDRLEPHNPRLLGGNAKSGNYQRFFNEVHRQLKEALCSFSDQLQKNSGMNCTGEQPSNICTWHGTGIFVKILADCSGFILEKTAACFISEDYIDNIESALNLVSGIGEPATWNLPQILLMQNLLNLIEVILQGTRHSHEYSSSYWTDAEEKIWKLLMHEKYWVLIKKYVKWLLLESSHGCFKNLSSHWKFWPEMPEALAIMLFSKPGFCLESPGFGHLKDVFAFLSSFTVLLHRRLLVNFSHAQDPSTLPQLAVYSLEFLMNPIDGLIMSILKGPYYQGRMIHSERELEGHLLDGETSAKENLASCSYKYNLDVSPTLKSGSEKLSASCMNDLSSSARKSMNVELHDKYIKMASQCKYSSSSMRGWSWQTSYLFKMLSQVNEGVASELLFKQRVVDDACLNHSLSSQLDHSHCQCRSCATRLVAQGLSLRMSLLIEEESLNLLAQIFSLKFSSCTTGRQLHADSMFQNPFLTQKYVEAFLDYHFLCFLQLYTWKTEDWQSKKQTNYSPMKSADYSLQESEDSALYIDTLSTGARHKSSSSDDFLSVVPSEDETISLACRKHGKILLAFSQNQTEDVSRRFKQLKLMDFLVHQIALEYELSHIATPRGIVVEGNEHEVLKKQRSSFPNDLFSHTKENQLLAKCALSKEKEDPQMKTVVSDNKDSNTIEACKDLGESIHDAIPKRHARTRCGINGISKVRSNEDNCMEVFHFPGLDSNSRHKLLSHTAVNDLGFFSCRVGSNYMKYGYPTWSGLQFPLIGSLHQIFSISQHNPYDFYTRLPISVPRLVLRASDSRESGRHQQKVRYADEGVLRCCERTGCLHDSGELQQYESSSFVFEHGTVSNTVDSENKTNQSHCKKKSRLKKSSKSHIGEANLNGSRCCNNFYYSGRFFDLNEEVEKELAQEEVAPSGHEEEMNRLLMSKSSGNISSGESNKVLGSPETCKLPASQQSRKLAGARPLVPKLNLPKSARKGDEDLSSARKPVKENLVLEDAPDKLKVKKKLHPEASQYQKGEVVLGTDYSGSSDKTYSFSYEREQLNRRIYRDFKLHVLLLELFVSLMVTSQGTLETSYTDRFPMEDINHASNAKILPFLRKRMKNFHPSAFRILKLVWKDLFDSSLYTNRQRIAHGAFAQIYTATCIHKEGENLQSKSVVLKTMSLSKGPHDPCKFFDVYSEVEILEKFIGDHRICQLLDYGVDIESYIIVLKHYKCSLRRWRQHHNLQFEREKNDSESLSNSFYLSLPLYLEIYAAVLQAVKVLESHNVVHYDLKCDNILLEPLETLQCEEDFWYPKFDGKFSLPFRVCIADFGQSKASFIQGGECTVRNRGTEYVKSPEMLKLLSTNKSDSSSLQLPATDGSVGKAVDVWGLGCLLYELLTGEYLLYDEDWTRFFFRVTLPSEDLITDEKAAKVNHFKPIMEFLHFVLVRDPVQRPCLDAVILQLEQLQLKLVKQEFLDSPSPCSCIIPNVCISSYDTTDTSSNVCQREMPVEPGCSTAGARKGPCESFSLENLSNHESNPDKVEHPNKDTPSSCDSCLVSFHAMSRAVSWWKTCINKFICSG